jgi:tetratricopeptide (TPR) repeat protein
MTSSATPSTSVPVSPVRPWIVGAWWDLAYLVLTPALIVPVVLIASRHWLTPEQISLAVISFASLGHHLPGFIRAYGDAQLRSRFRVRLLVAPLVIVALALCFTPPTSVARWLSLPWQHLHGLELVLLIWGTWHGLMQTYGFMRIYDLRRGENHRLDARLDHALCLVMFIGGVIGSDARAFGVANAMWQVGLPQFGPETLLSLRWLVGVAGVMVAWAYLWRLWVRHRQGLAFPSQKLLLALVTGWFFWYTGSLSTNLLIGVAMFEIYHAIQYNAIVWIYNRRLMEHASQQLGPWGSLFRDRWSMLGLYLAMIAAYSSIRYLAGDASNYIFFSQQGNSDAHQWLMALFVTSSFMHFYLDGFIWKVSEKKTQQNLAEPTAATSHAESRVPGLLHALKWGVLLAIVCGLLLTEKGLLTQDRAETQRRQVEALARLTPDLPECQILRSRTAFDERRYDEAAELARRAAELRPRSHIALSEAAAVLLEVGEPAEAEVLLQRALKLNPAPLPYAIDLAAAEAGQQKLDQAIARLNRVLEQDEFQPQALYLLGKIYMQQQRPSRAIPPLRRAVALDPGHAAAQLQLGTAFCALQKWKPAIAPLERAAELLPDQPNVFINLGTALLQSGDWERAEQAYRQGLTAAADSPQLNYNLGHLLLQTGRIAEGRALLEQAEETRSTPN